MAGWLFGFGHRFAASLPTSFRRCSTAASDAGRIAKNRMERSQAQPNFTFSLLFHLSNFSPLSVGFFAHPTSFGPIVLALPVCMHRSLTRKLSAALRLPSLPLWFVGDFLVGGRGYFKQTGSLAGFLFYEKPQFHLDTSSFPACRSRECGRGRRRRPCRFRCRKPKRTSQTTSTSIQIDLCHNHNVLLSSNCSSSCMQQEQQHARARPFCGKHTLGGRKSHSRLSCLIQSLSYLILNLSAEKSLRNAAKVDAVLDDYSIHK